MTSIDPRGPRFSAAITAALLAATLVLGTSTVAVVMLAIVAALFVVGATRGAHGSLQGIAFRRWIQPRLAPAAHGEDPRPPRFAQAVGLVVTGSGLILALAGLVVAVPVAAAIALAASFANAAFGYCLGCEMYLLVRRLRTA